MNDIIDKYNEDLKVDTAVDETNIKDQQMKLIANKHKWAARYILAKQELARMERQRSQIIDALTVKIRDSAAIGMSDLAARRAAESHESMRQYMENIDNQKLLIEFLDKVQDIMRSMTYDIKNIIEIMKLEVL